jgi:hypothetical protein
MPVLFLLATLPPGAVTLVPSVLYSQRVAHKSRHYDHLVVYIPYQGPLLSQLRFESLLLFDPSPLRECRVLFGALSLLFFAIAAG